ncbi:hypothetical protein HYFRA_00009038 [Hymenoscyphus fraxineus]|uniref:Serine hydrolase domain-containing protein n=1 Tax=Hymenoscyphus fraxineus TaxID=746836 RepID=A0A9N9PST1_9HELO|nr:hypothetical protein HYFRA_00009038 [Hymenoscyphus fraxineus]
MRFLCLHGMGTNGKIFEFQTEFAAKLRLGIGGDHEYIFIDGTVASAPAPGVQDLASSKDEFLRFAEENDVDGYLTLYNDLKILVEDEGPFDAVMAFSEGAAVAASLIVDHIRCTSAGEFSPFGFKCAIFLCSANPLDASEIQKGKLRLLSSDIDGRLIQIPTAHIWTPEDDVHPGFGMTLTKLCASDLMENHVHDLGHTIPGAQSDKGVPEAVRAIRRTLERAMEKDHEESLGV